MYFCINVIPNSMKKSHFLTICFVHFVAIVSFANPLDSLAIEKDKGKIFIIHRVEAQETLYSLLKRYNCTPAEVLAANPTLNGSSTIYTNQLLKIPLIDKKSKATADVIIKDKEATNKPLFHIVKEGETLYSIGKQYDLGIDELKNLNRISATSLTVGQKLIVDSTYRAIGPAADDKEVRKTPKASPVPNDYVPNAPTGKRINEVGIASVIESSQNSTKYLALHRFAPIGSLVKVRNEANGASIMVKVIGKLPDTGNNQDVLIRLSPAAFNQLNARENRIRASVEYVVSPR